MINLENQKVKEVAWEIHKAMLKKAKRGGKVKEDIVMENRLFTIIFRNPDIEPSKSAQELNDRYGYELSGNDVIEILKKRKMSRPAERAELFRWADKVALHFGMAIGGDKTKFEQFDEFRKSSALKNGRKHDSQDRIAAIAVYEKFPEIDLDNDVERLFTLGNTIAKFFFYDMVDAISSVYGLPVLRNGEKENKTSEKEMTYEQAINRIYQLESIIERTSIMLKELQDEFEEQLEESRVIELTDFFSKLNSEKYGCILDELLVVKKGVDELRKNNFALPLEINGLLIMVKKLIQFVRDSHIEPIMKINSTKEVVAADIEFCNYEGTPFSTPDEVKSIRVVSPGWIYKDKGVQISRPKIKEEKL